MAIAAMVDPDVNTPHAKLTVLTLSGDTMLDANQQPLSQIPVELTETVRQLKARITSKDGDGITLSFCELQVLVLVAGAKECSAIRRVC